MVADVIRQLVNRVALYPDQIQISVNVSALSVLLKGFLHSDSEPKKASKPRQRRPDSVASVTKQRSLVQRKKTKET